MLWRVPIALVTAVIVTLGLLFLMHKLIELGRVEMDQTAPFRIADFVRMRKESKTETKKRELPKKQKLDAQQAPPALKLSKAGGSGSAIRAVRISAPAPAVERKVRLVGGPSLGSAPSDAGSVPLVRINAMYPREAEQKRIEGWVLLEFDITTTGSVKNVRVIKSQPPRIFDQAARRAVRKWKYKPKIVNGKPVETRGVRVNMTFELPK